MSPTRISIKELHDRIGRLGASEIVLDVRGRDEFAELERRGLANLVCVADGGMADWLAAGYAIARGA